jgi:hypothetical protein
LDGTELEALDVLFDALEPCVGDIAGDNLSVVATKFSEVSGFSAGCGAEVEDGFAGLRVEQFCCVLGSFILNGPESFVESGEQFRVSGMTEMQAGVEASGYWGVAGGFEELLELLAGIAKWVDTECCSGW